MLLSKLPDEESVVVVNDVSADDEREVSVEAFASLVGTGVSGASVWVDPLLELTGSGVGSGVLDGVGDGVGSAVVGSGVRVTGFLVVGALVVGADVIVVIVGASVAGVGA